MSREQVSEERIAKLRTIVYTTLVDPSTVKLIGEREKIKIFTKMGIVKPRSEDIQLESLNTVYEPFYTIKGGYYIDYYRKKLYHLDIEEEVMELLVLEKTFKPKLSKLDKIRGKDREVELEAEQRIIKEKSAFIILNQKREEITLEKFPVAPSEENPEKILAENKKKKLEVTPEKTIEILRSKVVDRPEDVERTKKEYFEVSEHTLVYVPTIFATYKRNKTQEKKTISVNGVTGELLQQTETMTDETHEKTCQKCGKLNDEKAKFCRDCGQPFIQ
ncbi:MAG: zinc ribbon domain-containing protein [Candidatus Sifarchaeia archaeon]|jgi:ribosomal protein L40E